MNLAFKKMTGLEEIKLVECIVEPAQNEIKQFVDGLFGMNTVLRQIDVSMNQFGRESMNHFFKALTNSGSRIECLALS